MLSQHLASGLARGDQTVRISNSPKTLRVCLNQPAVFCWLNSCALGLCWLGLVCDSTDWALRKWLFVQLTAFTPLIPYNGVESFHQVLLDWARHHSLSQQQDVADFLCFTWLRGFSQLNGCLLGNHGWSNIAAGSWQKRNSFCIAHVSNQQWKRWHIFARSDQWLAWCRRTLQNPPWMLARYLHPFRSFEWHKSSGETLHAFSCLITYCFSLSRWRLGQMVCIYHSCYDISRENHHWKDTGVRLWGRGTHGFVGWIMMMASCR